MRDYVLFKLNGKMHRVEGAATFITLAEYLRYHCQLTGTKIVCAEGDCGACTVLKSHPHKKSQFIAINSCICLVGQLDGAHLISIEALELENQELHPVQKAMINNHGSQCGFCTPGFVMSMAWMNEKHRELSEQDIKNHLTGNLCRCTGYAPIIEAAKESLKLKHNSLSSRFLPKKSLNALMNESRSSACIKHEDKLFFIPKNLKDLAKIRLRHPHSTILAAGTDLGVQINKGKFTPKVIVSLQSVEELNKIKIKNNIIEVGATVSLSDFKTTISKAAPHVDEFLNIFASPQIKNMATLAGNLANASPIADTPAFLLALNAQLKILKVKSNKLIQIPLKDFYLSYKNTKLSPGDVIVSIIFDRPKRQEKMAFKKVSQRRDLDISCVNAGFWLKLSSRGLVEDCRLALGGVGPFPLRLLKTESSLIKKPLNKAGILNAIETLKQEIKPISDLRGSAEYRRFVSQKLLENFLLDSNKGAL